MKKLLLGIAALAFSLSCSRENAPCLEHPDWAPDVKEAVNDFLADCNGMENAYAVFDFDNTTAIFDVEEQTAVYQLRTMSFAIDPEGLRKALSTGLDGKSGESGRWIDDIVSAYGRLYSSYGPFTPAGLDENTQAQVHSDINWHEFATKMRLMYEKMRDWISEDESYNWILYWFTGMTGKDVYDLSSRACRYYSSRESATETWTSPENYSSKVGPVSITFQTGISVTENVKELWAALKAAGIGVWVCSASGIDQVMAGVDVFGLHDSCTGVLAMTIAKDEDGKYVGHYDFESGCARLAVDGGWETGSLPTKTQTGGPGKVVAIQNAIAPLYGGATPVACFMDSRGDFNFCTEFASTRLVLCFNWATKASTDAAGLIAETALYERDVLGFDYAKAKAAGETLYLLQGRDENGFRSLRPSNATINLGCTEERLLKNQDNFDAIEAMTASSMTVKEIIDGFIAATGTPGSGYHTR